MKRNFILLFTLVLFIGLKNSYAQTPDWTRVLQLNTRSYNTFNVVTTDATSIYAAASLNSNITFEGSDFTPIGNTDLLIIKTSHDGIVGWMKQLNASTNGTIYANALKVDGLGNLYVAGMLTGTSTIGSSTISSDATNNAFIAKFDTDGNGLWATTFLSTGTSYSKIALDATGNSYLISSSSKLLKFNSSGVKQWEQSFADKTLQAIAIYGSNLYLGGCLQGGTTNFGTIPLTSLGGINTGYLLKADLDGNYTNSIVVGGSSVNKGSSVSDIVCDNSGNLIITGGFVDGLILGAITINKPSIGLYGYVAKCDANFTFAWAEASSELFDENAYAMFFFRVFLDNSNNIYQYSMNTGFSVTYGSVSVPNTSAFIFKFDSNGNAINGNNLNFYSCTTLFISPNGKITLGSTDTSEGAASYGNIYISQLNGDVSLAWKKISSNSIAGKIKLNYIKHDSAGNTYLSSRLLGYCNYFGTNINANKSITIISKHDINGNLLWMNQIADINSTVNGASFSIDKDNNIITAGLFRTSLTVGTATLTTSNLSYEGYVAKYNTSGEFLWAGKMNLGDDGMDNRITVTTDKDNNVIASGGVATSNYIVKFDSNGNQLWAKIFPMESYYTSLISTDDNNNIYLATEIYLTSSTGSTTIGTLTLSQSVEDGATALVKFDPDGNALWAKTYGGVTGSSWPEGFPVDIKTDASGNSYLWGWFSNNSNFGTITLTNPFATFQDYSYYIAKINTSGDVVWAKAVYETKRSSNYGDLLDLDKSGNIYLGGHFNAKISIEGNEFIPEGLNDFFALKVSNDGEFQWIKTIPSDGNIINALSVFDNDVLSIVGIAGKNATLGSTTISKNGGSAYIMATLGSLKYIKVSSNILTVAATDNSTNTCSINSNISWTINSDQTWLGVSSTSGSGNATITLTAAANPLTVTRTATVTISGNGASNQTVTITQDAAEAVLSVSSNSLTVAAVENSTNTFNITSNINWAANSNQTWLAVSSANGSGNATITLTASANPLTTIRTATVTISGNGASNQTVTVIQDAAESILSVSTNSLTINASSNSTNTFDITSNISWTVLSDQSWLTPNNTTGSGNTTITLTASANPEVTNRNANVTVSGSGVSNRTIVVTQNGNSSGVDDLNNNKSIAVFPNPNKGKFIVCINNYNNCNVSIQITSSNGKIIKEIKLKSLTTSYNQNFELGNIANGVYFLTIQANNSKIVKPIVVSNN